MAGTSGLAFEFAVLESMIIGHDPVEFRRVVWTNSAQASTPIFQRIKDYLVGEIAAGRWKEGDLVPSEQALVRQFGVSRMTVNRAVRELTAEQVLTRRQGSGTYVAPQKYQATLVEIRNIADEVRARGHATPAACCCWSRARPARRWRCSSSLAPGAPLFHSLIVHFENGVPIQVEDRWVNPACAPPTWNRTSASITPNEHLMAAAPLQGATYSIEALPAPREVAEMLASTAGALPGAEAPHHLAGPGGLGRDDVASGPPVQVYGSVG
jgi:GntR family histidine utilization transcriptional repressor